ncbi:hypothetical protein L1987_24326 [Smallanthus sonchifolius]|uniref:Uncharacterized protein n=1 Tax=Smallanthus sonchifolius TaxID=185202 RepID=A0ACB9IMT1_9ASTR|nr:hypothetical protein L1987_24326 [Smallanthus sonchifolius]
MMELTDTCTTLQKKVAELKSEVADLKEKVAKHDLIIKELTHMPPVVLQPFNTYSEPYVAPTKEESSHKVSSSSKGDDIKNGEIIVTTKDTYEDIVSEEDGANVFEVLKKVLLQEGLKVDDNSDQHLSLNTQHFYFRISQNIPLSL